MNTQCVFFVKKVGGERPCRKNDVYTEKCNEGLEDSVNGLSNAPRYRQLPHQRRSFGNELRKTLVMYRKIIKL